MREEIVYYQCLSALLIICHKADVVVIVSVAGRLATGYYDGDL